MTTPTNEQIGTAIIDVYMAINRFQDLVYIPRHKGGNPPPALMAEECMKRIWSSDSDNPSPLVSPPVNSKNHLQFMLDMMQICINNMKE